MRRANEVEEKVSSTLAEGEKVVRTVRARRAWLVLTDRRLLLFSASLRGHPEELVLDEPLTGVEVEQRWLWRKLGRRLVIRSADAREVPVGLPATKGQATRWDQADALRRIVRDIRHWTTVATITAEQAASGQEVDAPFAHVHARALEAVTPADLARHLGLDPHHVRDVLEERFGVTVSKGAALKYTYTKQDLRQFDAATKEKLFVALVDELGAEGLVARSGGVAEEWWDTSAGKGIEAILDIADVEMAHASERRAPIARWRSRLLWVGFGVAAITAILVVPPMVWRGSWQGWRDGTHDRPDAAIYLGVAGVVALGALVLFSLLTGA